LNNSGDPRAQLRQKSVLTAVQASARKLQSKLAGPEKVKLDEHLSALADIEQRLSTVSQVSCTAPNPPAGGTDVVAATRDHLAIVREAFVCDRTRFVSAGWNLAGDAIPGVLDPSVKDLHTDIAHSIDAKTPEGAQARINMSLMQGWHAQKIADLMKVFAATPDGSGTLLDNTLIAWVQDFGEDVHGGLNVPYILLGGAQKKLRMGRYVRVNEKALSTNFADQAWRSYVPNNRLLASIMNAFGVSGDGFGSPEFPGALTGLT
jgi:hypothetical protein